MGLAFLAGAVSPGRVTEAITLNHRTGRPQTVPDSHWQAAVQRLQLSAEQAAHLGECGAEVLKLLRSQSAALHRLSSLANGHSLLVAAAEGQQAAAAPYGTQQPRLEALQQQEWRHLLHDMQRSPSQSQAAALGPPPYIHHSLPAPALGNLSPSGLQHQQQQQQQQAQRMSVESGRLVRSADAATAVVDAMDSHVSQLALWCFLLSFMVYDCLTPMQQARMIVACYPWSLQPVPTALAAGQLFPLLLQQQEEQHQGELSWPQQQQLQQQQTQREHQQQHRQLWWRDRLAELPLTSEEAQHIAMAGVCEAGDAAATTSTAAAAAAAAAEP